MKGLSDPGEFVLNGPSTGSRHLLAPSEPTTDRRGFSPVTAKTLSRSADGSSGGSGAGSTGGGGDSSACRTDGGGGGSSGGRDDGHDAASIGSSPL